MRFVRAWAVLLCAGLVAIDLIAMQEAPAPRPRAPRPERAKPEENNVALATVHGSVASTGGERVEGVRIILIPESGGRRRPVTARTDAIGRFSAAGVAPGRYRVRAQREGFAWAEYGARRPGQRGTALEVGAGQQVRDVVISLVPAAVIAGRVADEAGKPIRGVAVQTLRESYASGRRDFVPAGTATSDDTGGYRVAELAPGRYYLRAFTPSRQLGRRGGRQPEEPAVVTYRTSFYPGSEDDAGAVPIDVSAGSETRGLDFTLRKAGGTTVRGTVTFGGTRQPARGAILSLRPQQGLESGPLALRTAAVRNAQGQFEFPHVDPGMYTLTADAVQGKVRFTAAESISVSESEVAIDLQLREAAVLRGSFAADPAEAPMDFSNARVSLRSTGPSVFGRLAAKAEAGGQFEIENVGDGEYRVDVSGLPEGAYVRSLRLGGQEMAASMLSVAGAAGVLEVVVSPRGGRVTGTVTDSEQKPVPGAQIVLVPNGERRQDPRSFRTATSDETGAFQLSGIRPGDYSLFAWDELEAGAQYNPAFLSRFNNDAVTVSLDEAETVSARLPVLSVAER